MNLECQQGIRFCDDTSSKNSLAIYAMKSTNMSTRPQLDLLLWCGLVAGIFSYYLAPLHPCRDDCTTISSKKRHIIVKQCINRHTGISITQTISSPSQVIALSTTGPQFMGTWSLKEFRDGRNWKHKGNRVKLSRTDAFGNWQTTTKSPNLLCVSDQQKGWRHVLIPTKWSTDHVEIVRRSK